MLIGEVVPEALAYLRHNPSSREFSAFDHVLVDEYQDLNRAEHALLDHLIRDCCYAIFGDEDQSIYSFRWAHPAGIAEFDQTHPGTQDYQLDECRRCPTRVVEMANYLIRHNHTAASLPRLLPRAGNASGDVHIVQWGGLDEEAQGVTQFVRILVGERVTSPATSWSSPRDDTSATASGKPYGRRASRPTASTTRRPWRPTRRSWRSCC
jgi:superfamily I DNA/RNA helicase